MHVARRVQTSASKYASVDVLREIAEVRQREERRTARMRTAVGEHAIDLGWQDLGLAARTQCQQGSSSIEQAANRSESLTLQRFRVASAIGGSPVHGRPVHPPVIVCVRQIVVPMRVAA